MDGAVLQEEKKEEQVKDRLNITHNNKAEEEGKRTLHFPNLNGMVFNKT